jgi:hypothetical protein
MQVGPCIVGIQAAIKVHTQVQPYAYTLLYINAYMCVHPRMVYKRLKLAQLLGQLGGFLICAAAPPPPPPPACLPHMNAWTNLHILGQPKTLLAAKAAIVDLLFAAASAAGGRRRWCRYLSREVYTCTRIYIY